MKFALLLEAQRKVFAPSALLQAYLAIGEEQLCKAVTDAQGLSATIKDDDGQVFDRTIVNAATTIEIELITTVDADDDIPFISAVLTKVIKSMFAPYLVVDVKVDQVGRDSGMPYITFIITQMKQK